MNVWRLFGALVCMAGLMVLVSGSVSVNAQDKDKKDDKGKTETKADDKKAADKKSDDKKSDDKKADDKKADDKKADDKKADDKKGADDKKTGGGAAWKAFDKGSVFYQVLTTNTTQDMKVMGQEISQKQKQTFLIKWEALDKDSKGNYVVNQEIVGLKMTIDIGGNTITYDSTAENQPQNPMTDFFKALLNLKLKLTISPKLKVVDVENQDKFIADLAKTNPQMEPLLKSILSKEALQQMAEPTWGAFPPDGADKKWSNDKEPSVLNLGPIGKYTTKFYYTAEGEDKSNKALDRIGITATLSYEKPDSKNNSGLPFVIKDATLTSKDGTGYALFDRAKGRFAESSMKMKLEGDLTIEVGGMDTKVNLVQTQDALVKTSDEIPDDFKAKKK